MRRLFTLIACVSFIQLNAQTPDSVILGAAYAGRAYYNIGTMNDTIIPNNDWDIAIASNQLYTVSVRINAGKGVELYKFSGDTTSWATLDTAGLQGGVTWVRCHDSDTSFEPSAFEAGATGHPNYGWGVYNNITHDVVGEKLFVIRLYGGSGWKKVWIKKFNSVANSMTFRVADLDNNNDNTFTVFKNTNKNYTQVTLSSATILDREPAKGSYDLIFDQYETNVGIYYPVTGVRSNEGVKVTQANDILPDDALTNWYNNYYPSSTNMIEIGHDWKTFAGSWTIEDSTSYFVEDLQGDVYQIWFTGFVGSSAGKYYFNVRQAGWVSVEDENQTIANFNVYPNPVADVFNVAYTLNNEFDHATLTIMDVNGKLMFNQVLANNQGFNNTLLDAHSMNLSSGIYVARLQVGNSSSALKFIVR